MTKNTYNLDEAMDAGRQTIDAKWSPKTKKTVIGLSVLVTVGAITGGIWAASAFATPGMPSTAQEALAVLGTPRFERMSADRRSAYAEEAGRLLRELPEEDRRAMFRDEDQRDAMRAMMEQRMADMARAVARGETPDFAAMFGGMRPPRGDNAERRQRREEMTDEEREQRRADMQDRMRDRMSETFKSGNAQNSELMGEMFRSGMGRMGPGGRGGRGGGGGGGERGGGGGTRG